MISKLRKISKAINSIDKIHRSNDDAYALQIIHKLFPEYCFLPFTPFSLNPYTILHILNDILLNERRQIIEFGGGLSSIIISRFLKINKLNANIVSFDNNIEWQNIIAKETKKYECDEYLTQIHCPIQPVKNQDFICYDNRTWYDDEKIAEYLQQLKTKIDVVIVDGPSTSTSEYLRYPAVPSLKNKLAESAIIFLDDTKRLGEQEILKQWNIAIKGELKFEKMYGTITIGKRFSTRPLSH
ncbi:MAG: class I SAM-dependent methyltransferase [Jejuia sp.]